MSLLPLDPFSGIERFLGQATSLSRRLPVPIDAYRADGKIELQVDLPGVKPETIELSVENNVLTLEAETADQLPADAEVFVHERPIGTFRRQIELGGNLDTAGVSAEYRDGVLRVLVPVAETAKVRKIAVGSGARAAIDTSAA